MEQSNKQTYLTIAVNRLQFFHIMMFAVVTIASMLAYKKTGIILYSYFSYFFMLITTLVVLLVGIRTIQHMLKKEICIAE